MRIAGTIKHSYNNGDGIRFVVFTQGCKHHCKGCQNPDTWDFNGGEEIAVEDLADEIKATRFLDGVTLSGGDPYYQYQECIKLLQLLPKKYNIWIYTGFEWNEIKDNPLTALADVVVTGQFIEKLKCKDKMYGSSNQEIHYVKEELK